MAMFQFPHLPVGVVKLKVQHPPVENGENE